MGMRKRLAKAIWKSGSTDPDSIALYLIDKGWRDTERRPVMQQVTVTPNPLIQAAVQQQNTSAPEVFGMRKLPWL